MVQPLSGAMALCLLYAHSGDHPKDGIAQDGQPVWSIGSSVILALRRRTTHHFKSGLDQDVRVRSVILNLRSGTPRQIRDSTITTYIDGTLDDHFIFHEIDLFHHHDLCRDLHDLLGSRHGLYHARQIHLESRPVEDQRPIEHRCLHH